MPPFRFQDTPSPFTDLRVLFYGQCNLSQESTYTRFRPHGSAHKKPKALDTTRYAAGVEDLKRKAYSIDETAALLGWSRAKAYAAANDGTLPVIRHGNRIIVPVTALEKWLETAGQKPNP